MVRQRLGQWKYICTIVEPF